MGWYGIFCTCNSHARDVNAVVVVVAVVRATCRATSQVFPAEVSVTYVLDTTPGTSHGREVGGYLSSTSVVTDF